jgi:solute carrier family 35 protein F5
MADAVPPAVLPVATGAARAANDAVDLPSLTAVDTTGPALPPYSIVRVAYASLLFCPLWFLANCLFNYSLSGTSVASNTILSSTSTVWAMLFSRVLLGEAITVRKLFSVALSIGGAALVGLFDTAQSGGGGGSTAVGNFLAALSAVFYAAYTTVLRTQLPDERRFHVGMCFGFVGLFNVLLLWPGFGLLSALGVEKFELPPTGAVWGTIIGNGLIGTNLSDVLWAKSVLLTSPLIATLGLSLTIPFAMVADLVLKQEWHGPLYLVGAVCVTAGFVVANWPSRR